MISWFEKRKVLSWSATFIIAVAIFIISSISFSAVVAGSSGIRAIIYHVSAFFFLALFLFISLINGKKRPFLIFLAFFVAVIYGISDEIHQYFVPGRFLSVSDILFDTIGIFYAFMIYFISIEYRNGKKYMGGN